MESYTEPDPSNIIWDNSTTGDHNKVQIYVNRNQQAFHLIGLAFLGGCVLGFIIHCFYNCLIRHFLSRLDEASTVGGIVNLSFIGDDSRPPVNDEPPDYDSVMGRDSGGTAASGNHRCRNFFKRFLRRRKSSTSVSNPVEDEPPPTYSSVVVNLERELSTRP